jgi:hypothetical protein
VMAVAMVAACEVVVVAARGGHTWGGHSGHTAGDGGAAREMAGLVATMAVGAPVPRRWGWWPHVLRWLPRGGDHACCWFHEECNMISKN